MTVKVKEKDRIYRRPGGRGGDVVAISTWKKVDDDTWRRMVWRLCGDKTKMAGRSHTLKNNGGNLPLPTTTVDDDDDDDGAR